MRFNTQAYFVATGNTFLLNGQDEIDISNGYSGYGITVRSVGDVNFLDFSGGVSVKWDQNDAWFLTIKNDRFQGTNIRGLCGNNNGDPMGKSRSYET